MPNIFKIPGIFMIEKVPSCEKNVSGSSSQDGTFFAYCSASTIFVNPMEWDAFTRTASPDFKI